MFPFPVWLVDKLRHVDWRPPISSTFLRSRSRDTLRCVCRAVRSICGGKRTTGRQPWSETLTRLSRPLQPGFATGRAAPLLAEPCCKQNDGEKLFCAVGLWRAKETAAPTALCAIRVRHLWNLTGYISSKFLLLFERLCQILLARSLLSGRPRVTPPPRFR